MAEDGGTTAPGLGSVGICLDLDGTAVATPLFLMVASAVDLVEEIEVLSQATQSGQLPFARSLRLRCRILEDVPVSEASRRLGVATVDRHVAQVIEAKRDRVHLITELPDAWLSGLAERLGCDIVSSTADVRDDRLIAVPEVIDKVAAVERLKERYDTVVAVGSGVDDLGMLQAADVRVRSAPARRHPCVRWRSTGSRVGGPCGSC